MPRAGTTTTSARGRRSAIRSATARNFSSRSPTTSVDRHRELPQPVPQRRHHARADPPQRGRQARGRVAQPVRVRGRARTASGWPANTRLRAPAPRERLDRRALELVRERLVGGAARGPLGRVLDPGRGAHQHQALDAARARRARRAARGGRPSSSPRSAKRGGASAATSATQASKRRPAGRPRAAPWPAEVGRRAAGTVRRAPRRTGSQLAPVWVKPWSRTSAGAIAPIMTARRHLPAAPRLRGRARPLRAARRVHVARLALHAARALAGPRAAHPQLLAPRRARRRASSRSASAKASGVPAALACTSGTAAAHYAPAVIEAHEARVPLLVLTADRPPELREVGAGQTIDQLKLYGSAAKWFFEVGTHEATPERLRWMRTLACRAFWTAVERAPRPRAPELPAARAARARRAAARRRLAAAPGRPPVGGPPRPLRAAPPPGELPRLGAARGGRRGPLGAPRRRRRGSASLWRRRRAGRCWPTRSPAPARGAAAIAHYDALLRDEGFAAAHRPEVVVRVGDLPTSKPLRAWLARARPAPSRSPSTPRARGRTPPAWPRPSCRATPRRRCGPCAEQAPRTRAGWTAGARADAAAAERARRGARATELTEPRVAAELGARLPAAATLVVASSMPVRDVETFWPGARPTRRACSPTAARTASTAPSRPPSASPPRRAGPVVLLIGDVALAHDLGGLLAARRLGLRADDRAARQRRRRDLPLPARRRRERRLRGARRHAARARLRARRRALRLRLRARRRRRRPSARALDARSRAERTTIVEVRTDREENVADPSRRGRPSRRRSAAADAPRRACRTRPQADKAPENRAMRPRISPIRGSRLGTRPRAGRQ